MLYGYLAGLSHQLVGLSTIVVLGTIVVFRKFNHWSALLLGLAVAYLLTEKHTVEGNNFIEQMESHLNSALLKDTKFFYLDPDLINLFVSIKEYNDYSPVLYYQLKHTVDQILRNLRVIQMGVDLPANLLQESIDLMEEAFKLFESLSYHNASDSASLSKHDYNKKLLRQLLHAHLDQIYHLTGKYYQQRGIDASTKFVYPHHPSAYSFDGQVAKFTRC